MKKINIFSIDSPLFPYRWFVIITLAIGSWMAYHDLTGKRMFQSSNQQQWASKGPGYHK